MKDHIAIGFLKFSILIEWISTSEIPVVQYLDSANEVSDGQTFECVTQVEGPTLINHNPKWCGTGI